MSYEVACPGEPTSNELLINAYYGLPVAPLYRENTVVRAAAARRRPRGVCGLLRRPV